VAVGSRIVRAGERAVLGALMTAIAFFAERRLRKAIRKTP
jgi:hypothetical protein